MGSSNYSISKLETYDAKLSEIGVDIYGGPRGSLAGTLPAWIGWWVHSYRYSVGHIVYMPGVYNASNQQVNFSARSSATHMTSLRDEIEWPQSIAELIAHDRELTGGDIYEPKDADTYGAGKKQYFDYGDHSLWIKLFGELDDNETNNVNLGSDLEFHNVQNRRKHGWYCFAELKASNDPATGSLLKIAIPEKGLDKGTFSGESNGYIWQGSSLNVYEGKWDTGFREEECKGGTAQGTSMQTTEIKLGAEEVCLNLCDAFAVVAASYTSVPVYFIICKSVITSPESSSKVHQVAIQPMDRLSIGGNVLRSPKETDATDIVPFATNTDFAKKDATNIEKYTIVSAGYPGIMQPQALFRNTPNAKQFQEGTLQMKDNIADLNSFPADTLYLDKIKYQKIKAFDPRYGEANISLNSFVNSAADFHMPTTKSKTKLWQSGKSYKMGEWVVYYRTSSEKDNNTAKYAFVKWVARVDHTSSSGNTPPVGSGKSFPNELQNSHWRLFGVMANNPNTSFSYLDSLYNAPDDSPVRVTVPYTTLVAADDAAFSFTDFSKWDDDNLVENWKDLFKPANKNKKRIRMSEMSGGSKLYASLTISPARKWSSKTYYKRNFWGRRKSISFRYPPVRSDCAKADLWLYTNNLRKDHAGQIAYAVSFVDYTSFVWAQAKKRKIGFFTILLGVALCVIGVLNPALALGVAGKAFVTTLAGAWAAAGVAGVIGLGAGLAVGASAEYVYGRIRGGVAQKKLWQRSSFAKVVRTIGTADASVNSSTPLIGRAKSAEGHVTIGGDRTNVNDNLYGSWSGVESNYGQVNNENAENDIVRFSFDSLYPYLYESKHSNTIFISGEYQFIIQDLNSALTMRAHFSYEEISKRKSMSERDSFGNSFTGVPNGSSESPWGGVDANLWSTYQTYANKIVSSGTNSANDLKLITTRNYFHYLLLGPKGMRQPSDPIQANTAWTMTIPANLFGRLIGSVQTGFRGLVYNSSGNLSGYSESTGISSDFGGLGDYQEYFTGQPLTSAPAEAAPGFVMDTEGTGDNAKITKVRRSGSTTGAAPISSVDDLDDSERMKTLALGLKPSAFTATSGIEDVKLGEFSPTPPDSGLDDMDAIPGTLKRSDFWKVMIESEDLSEKDTDRGAAYSVPGRKIDFSFNVQPSLHPALVPLFFFGYSRYIPEYSHFHFSKYSKNSIVKVVSHRFPIDISGQEMFDREDIQVGCNSFFKLAKDLEILTLEDETSYYAPGSVPGLKTDENWIFLGFTGSVNDSSLRWHLPEIRDGSQPLYPGDNLLEGGRCSSFPTIEDSSSGQMVIDAPSAQELLDKKFDYNLPLIRTGATSFLDPYKTSDEANWKSIMQGIINSENPTHLFDSGATSVFTAEEFEKPGGSGLKVTIDRIVISKIADLLGTNTITVWKQGASYDEGDIVAFEYTNYDYLPENLDVGTIDDVFSSKFWLFAKAKNDIDGANNQVPPFYEDDPYPETTLKQLPQTIEFQRAVIPISTKYWECISSRAGASEDALSIRINSKDLYGSYFGTDVSIVGYSLNTTGESYKYTIPDRSEKTIEPYDSAQLSLASDQVDMFFDTSSNIGAGNIIYTTTKSESLRIPGAFDANILAYKNDDSNGLWPGKEDDFATQTLSLDEWTKIDEPHENPIIDLFLTSTKNMGANWRQWMTEDAAGKITLTQKNEFLNPYGPPKAELLIQGKSLSLDRNYDDSILLFHRGRPIIMGINAEVYNEFAAIVNASSAKGNSQVNSLDLYIAAVSDVNEVNLKGVYGPTEKYSDIDAERDKGVEVVIAGSHPDENSLENEYEDIENKTYREKIDRIRDSDLSGNFAFGNDFLSRKIVYDSLSVGTSDNFIKVTFPENYDLSNPGNAFVKKTMAVLATMDDYVGSKQERASIEKIAIDTNVSGSDLSGLNFYFENVFASPEDSLNSSRGIFLVNTSKNKDEDGEGVSDAAYMIESNINSLPDVMDTLWDISGGAGGGTIFTDGYIGLRSSTWDGNDNSHYSNFGNQDMSQLIWDPFGLNYLGDILIAMGNACGRNLNATQIITNSTVPDFFDESGNYVGGVGLNWTSASFSDFYLISQASFRPETIWNLDDADNLWVYGGEIGDFESYLQLIIPSLSYKYYQHNDDPNDLVTMDYYEKLPEQFAPGGADAKADFSPIYAFKDKIKFGLEVYQSSSWEKLGDSVGPEAFDSIQNEKCLVKMPVIPESEVNSTKFRLYIEDGTGDLGKIYRLNNDTDYFIEHDYYMSLPDVNKDEETQDDYEIRYYKKIDRKDNNTVEKYTMITATAWNSLSELDAEINSQDDYNNASGNGNVWQKVGDTNSGAYNPGGGSITYSTWAALSTTYTPFIDHYTAVWRSENNITNNTHITNAVYGAKESDPIYTREDYTKVYPNTGERNSDGSQSLLRSSDIDQNTYSGLPNDLGYQGDFDATYKNNDPINNGNILTQAQYDALAAEEKMNWTVNDATCNNQTIKNQTILYNNIYTISSSRYSALPTSSTQSNTQAKIMYATSHTKTSISAQSRYRHVSETQVTVPWTNNADLISVSDWSNLPVDETARAALDVKEDYDRWYVWSLTGDLRDNYISNGLVVDNSVNSQKYQSSQPASSITLWRGDYLEFYKHKTTTSHISAADYDALPAINRDTNSQDDYQKIWVHKSVLSQPEWNPEWLNKYAFSGTSSPRTTNRFESADYRRSLTEAQYNALLAQDPDIEDKTDYTLEDYSNKYYEFEYKKVDPPSIESVINYENKLGYNSDEMWFWENSVSTIKNGKSAAIRISNWAGIFPARNIYNTNGIANSIRVTIQGNNCDIEDAQAVLDEGNSSSIFIPISDITSSDNKIPVFADDGLLTGVGKGRSSLHGPNLPYGGENSKNGMPFKEYSYNLYKAPQSTAPTTDFILYSSLADVSGKYKPEGSSYSDFLDPKFNPVHFGTILNQWIDTLGYSSAFSERTGISWRGQGATVSPMLTAPSGVTLPQAEGQLFLPGLRARGEAGNEFNVKKLLMVNLGLGATQFEGFTRKEFYPKIMEEIWDLSFTDVETENVPGTAYYYEQDPGGQQLHGARGLTFLEGSFYLDSARVNNAFSSFKWGASGDSRAMKIYTLQDDGEWELEEISNYYDKKVNINYKDIAFIGKPFAKNLSGHSITTTGGYEIAEFSDEIRVVNPNIGFDLDFSVMYHKNQTAPNIIITTADDTTITSEGTSSSSSVLASKKWNELSEDEKRQIVWNMFCNVSEPNWDNQESNLSLMLGVDGNNTVNQWMDAAFALDLDKYDPNVWEMQFKNIKTEDEFYNETLDVRTYLNDITRAYRENETTWSTERNMVFGKTNTIWFAQNYKLQFKELSTGDIYTPEDWFKSDYESLMNYHLFPILHSTTIPYYLGAAYEQKSYPGQFSDVILNDEDLNIMKTYHKRAVTMQWFFDERNQSRVYKYKVKRDASSTKYTGPDIYFGSIELNESNQETSDDSVVTYKSKSTFDLAGRGITAPDIAVPKYLTTSVIKGDETDASDMFMGTFCHTIDPPITAETSLNSTPRRRFFGAGPKILHTKHTPLKQMIVSYDNLYDNKQNTCKIFNQTIYTGDASATKYIYRTQAFLNWDWKKTSVNEPCLWSPANTRVQSGFGYGEDYHDPCGIGEGGNAGEGQFIDLYPNLMADLCFSKKAFNTSEVGSSNLSIWKKEYGDDGSGNINDFNDDYSYSSSDSNGLAIYFRTGTGTGSAKLVISTDYATGTELRENQATTCSIKFSEVSTQGLAGRYSRSYGLLHSSRLAGWSVSNPHLSCLKGLSNPFEDDSQYMAFVGAHGLYTSHYGGMKQIHPKNAWGKKGSNYQDPLGKNSVGYIGLRSVVSEAKENYSVDNYKNKTDGSITLSATQVEETEWSDFYPYKSYRNIDNEYITPYQWNDKPDNDPMAQTDYTDTGGYGMQDPNGNWMLMFSPQNTTSWGIWNGYTDAQKAMYSRLYHETGTTQTYIPKSEYDSLIAQHSNKDSKTDYELVYRRNLYTSIYTTPHGVSVDIPREYVTESEKNELPKITDYTLYYKRNAREDEVVPDADLKRITEKQYEYLEDESALDFSTRMTKIVNGVHPGVTYRLYINVCTNAGGGKSGARVYVVEPKQGHDVNGAVDQDLIAYGEFSHKVCRSVNYNAKNEWGGIGQSTNFSSIIDEPFYENTSAGFVSEKAWPDNALLYWEVTGATSSAKSVITYGEYQNLQDTATEEVDGKSNYEFRYSSTQDLGNVIQSSKFTLYYVEFTPTHGSNLVEIRIENAFIQNTVNYKNNGGTLVRSAPASAPTSWNELTEEEMFSSSVMNQKRKSWTQYSGPWVNNGLSDSETKIDNENQTVYIRDAFITSVRPLYTEKIKFNVDCPQRAFELNLNNGDSKNSTAHSVVLRERSCNSDILSKLANDKKISQSAAILSLPADSKGGWFEADRDYELTIIRPHTHFLNWDPFSIDFKNRRAFWPSVTEVIEEDYFDDPNFHPNLLNGYYYGGACVHGGSIYVQGNITTGSGETTHIIYGETGSGLAEVITLEVRKAWEKQEDKNNSNNYGTHYKNNWKYGDHPGHHSYWSPEMYTQDGPGGATAIWEKADEWNAVEILKGRGHFEYTDESPYQYNDEIQSTLNILGQAQLMYTGNWTDSLFRFPFQQENLTETDSFYVKNEDNMFFSDTNFQLNQYFPEEHLGYKINDNMEPKRKRRQGSNIDFSKSFMRLPFLKFKSIYDWVNPKKYYGEFIDMGDPSSAQNGSLQPLVSEDNDILGVDFLIGKGGGVLCDKAFDYLEDTLTVGADDSAVTVDIKFNRTFETFKYVDEWQNEELDLNIKFDTFNLEGDSRIQDKINNLENPSLESQTWIAATVWNEDKQQNSSGDWLEDKGSSDFHIVQKALTISPDFPVCNILTNSIFDMTGNNYSVGSWSSFHSSYDISEPAIADLQGALWESNYQEGHVEKMIFAQQHKAIQCGIGTSVYFCPRGLTFDEKVHLPLRAMKKPDGSFSFYIADHYYGASNPIAHSGMAELISRAPFMNDSRFLPGEFEETIGEGSEYNANAFLPWQVFDVDRTNGVSKNFDPVKTELWSPRVSQV